MFREQSLHVPAGVKEPAHNRAFGALHGLRHVRVRQPLELPHHDDRTMLVAETIEAGLNGCPNLFVFDRGRWIARNGCCERHWNLILPTNLFVELDRLLSIGAPQVIDAEVRDNAVEPGVKTRLALEVVDIAVNFDKGFLNNVERIFLVPQESVRHSKDFALIALIEQSESSPISGLGGCDQFSVIGIG